jgi:hypothetical protein
MPNPLIEDYVKFTPKAKAILSILLVDYELNETEGLTRKQIAHHLGQARLYPHDDRAIRQLEQANLVFVASRRLGTALAYQYHDTSFLQSKHISMYTRFHIHWLNGIYYDYLIYLLKSDGLYEEPELGVIGDVLDTAESVWRRLKSLFIGSR